MFARHFNGFGLRSVLLAGCLVLLAACVPKSGGPNGTGADGSSSGGMALAAVPANLAATAGNAQVSLTWSASSGATSYNVKRATTSGGPYSQVSAPDSTTYTDTALTNGTTYYYVVSAVNSAGESADSTQVSAVPTAPQVSIPPVPAGVTATAGNAQVSLTWSASNGATSYNVKRATTSGGPYSQVSAPTSTTFTDTSLTNGTKYYYVISAVNSGGESANSAEVSAVPTAPVPSVPVNVAATAGNAQVSLTWSGSSNATSYHVKRATTNGGPYAQVGAPTATTFTDTSVTNDTTYYYVVSAVNSTGESANSTQVSAIPSAPTFGTWSNVSPSNVVLNDHLDCFNVGTQSVQQDTSHPSNIYAQFGCQGIWKSTDYGQTWTGPINTGTNGSTVSDCAGVIAVSATGGVPIIYEVCIRGAATGFWKSTDGGVNWTNYPITATTRQDYYEIVIDPYDPKHILLSAHEFDSLVESTDGGQTWSSVSLNSGMLQTVWTGFVFFINTGNASTTRSTWLWMGEQFGPSQTWRTADGGKNWTAVDMNQCIPGFSQIYQPDTNGVLYMAGVSSALGNGVLRSTDYGVTWAHVGITSFGESAVAGTSKYVYAMWDPNGPGDNQFEVAAQPGTGTWATPGVPSGLTRGAANILVINDGTHNILLGSMWTDGLWRYIEP